MPSRETSSVVTNYETEKHIAKTGRCVGHATPTAMNTQATIMQASTSDYLQKQENNKNEENAKKKKTIVERKRQI